MTMHVRLEPHTFGHRAGDFDPSRARVIDRPQHLSHVHFAAFEQAGSQYAFGGETEAVAGRAEWGRHRADEPDATLRAAEAINLRRSYARFACAIDRFEWPERRFNALTHFRF